MLEPTPPYGGNAEYLDALYEQYLPLIHYENRQCGLRATKALMREGVWSMVAIPLRLNREPTGFLVFYWKTLHRITEAEVHIASALGSLAAAALGTAELYDREMKLRAEAEASERRAAFLADAGAGRQFVTRQQVA